MYAAARRQTQLLNAGVEFVDTTIGRSYGACASDVKTWALAQDFARVVWTNLPCGFRHFRSVMPSGEDVLVYLRSLDAGARGAVHEYVERTPG